MTVILDSNDKVFIAGRLISTLERVFPEDAGNYSPRTLLAHLPAICGKDVDKLVADLLIVLMPTIQTSRPATPVSQGSVVSVPSTRAPGSVYLSPRSVDTNVAGAHATDSDNPGTLEARDDTSDAQKQASDMPIDSN